MRIAEMNTMFGSELKMLISWVIELSGFMKAFKRIARSNARRVRTEN